MICKIKTDIGCRVYIDDILKGVAEAGRIFVLHLEKGQYFVRYESLYDSADFIEKVLAILDLDVVEQAYLLPVVDRKKLLLKPYLENGLWGFAEWFSNKVIIKPEYSEASRFYNREYAFVSKQGLKGVIDYLGNTVLECAYDEISILENNWFFVTRNGRKDLLHPTMQANIPFDEIMDWGYLHKTRQVIFYDDGTEYEDENIKDVVILYGKGSSVLFSLPLGKCVFTYDGGISPECPDGYIKVYTPLYGCNQKYGLIDMHYRFITPVKYRDIGRFKNGIAKVSSKVNGETVYGLINTKGEEIAHCMYRQIGDFSEGMACALKMGDDGLKYGFLDALGNEATPFIYSEVDSFSEGLAAVNINKYNSVFRGFINKKGESVIDLSYFPGNLKGLFKNGLCRLSNSDKTKHGFIDQQGKILYQWDAFEYDYLIHDDDNSSLVPGLRLIKKNGLYGFINKRGIIEIPIVYQSVLEEKNGFVSVKKNGKWGLLDSLGKEVFSFVYGSYFLINNMIEVSNSSNQLALYSLSGLQVTGFAYDKIIAAGDRFFVVNKEYVGVIDKSGHELVPCNVYKKRGNLIDSAVQCVYYGNKPGLLLASNLRFYPTSEEENCCGFDPDSSILITSEANRYGELLDCRYYLDVETGMSITPRGCPSNTVVKRDGQRIILKFV